ncbi:unnamed protein product [Heterobilharzia americana]|nr:unnamed protein product [Heterobilharzia americana]
MSDTCQLQTLLKVTSVKTDIQDEFLTHYINKIIRIILSSESSGTDTEIVILSVKCLINICATSQGIHLLTTMLSAKENHEEFTKAVSAFALNNSKNIPELKSSAVALVSNLTRDPVWLDLFGKHFDSQHIKTILDSHCSVQQFLPIILNLTAKRSVRCSLSSTVLPTLIGLFPKMNSTSDKILIAGIIKNCSFEDELHCKLLDKSAALLDTLLIPLCGPEDCINEEDRGILPHSVQTVSGNSQFPRLFSTELYLTICQTFLQLCATVHGRTILRSNGVYFILRELHKYISKVEEQIPPYQTEEKTSNKELLFYVEQVVDQLICEENERDKQYADSSLRKITIDQLPINILLPFIPWLHDCYPLSTDSLHYDRHHIQFELNTYWLQYPMYP